MTRKIKWGWLPLIIICCVGLWMTTVDKYMARLAESTDQIFWIVLISHMVIWAYEQMFPKKDNSQTLPTNEETQRNLKNKPMK